jgi:hypothetical protein
MTAREAPDDVAAGRRALLVAGAAAGPLFVLGFTLQSATRAGYDWRQHP